MRYPREFRAAIFVLLFSVSQLPANAADFTTGGQALYQAGKYADAARVFAFTVKVNPRNFLAEYWYAMSEMKLGNYDKARDAFQSIVNSDSTGLTEIGKLARQGVQNCLAAPYAQHQSAAYRQQQALSRIERQGGHAANRQLKNWNAVSDAAKEASDKGSEALDKQAARAEKDMQSWQINTSDGGQIPVYSKGQIRAVVKTYTDQKDNLVAAEKQSQVNAQAQGQRSASSIAEDVNVLQQQLLGNEEPAGLKLIPDGTNLYTRNYASTAPSQVQTAKQPAELKAAQERMILSPHTIPGKTVSKTSQPANKPELKVKGEITQP